MSRPDAPRRKRWQLRIVVAATLVLVGAGVVGSTLTANSIARHDAEKSRHALEVSSVQVASTLWLALQREEDLAVSATGFFVTNPYATDAGFAAWSKAVHVSARYPELLGWGQVVMVTREQLPGFRQRLAANAGDPAAGSFEVLPTGDRPFYCFVSVSQSYRTGNPAPMGFDYCAGSTGEQLLAARDMGRSSYQTVDTGNGSTLSVQVPMYRPGTNPSTVEERRDAFVGWAGLGFDPKTLISSALHDHPSAAVSLRFHDNSSDVEFTSGEAPAGAASATVSLGNGWTAETFTSVSTPGVFSDRGAWLVLLGGTATSVMFGALVLVLGTGRARAWQLVGQRTGELQHQALHDALTGLPNRALIMDRIEQLLARSRRHGTVGSALYIDLDDFKNVNDTLGHEAGDRLLVAAATRLRAALRDVDTIGRMGGDEFVVLIDDATLDAAPELVAQRLLQVMRQPFELDGTSMPLLVNTSIGIAVGDRESGGDLLRDADVALYQAKATGKNRYEMFRPEMQTEIGRRIELEFELRSAMDNDQFALVYQPIYNLDDLALVGVEALLRWNNPSLGAVEPTEFIPILERTGHIRDVGRWVLDRACTQMARWHARGNKLSVSVNVSGRQLDHDDIIEHVREALADSGLDPAALILEVTETALMHNATATARRLAMIRALGPHIAVDDFGTGYSSLAYLQQFPVDCLKIDRRFTHAITSSPESKALISTLVQLGKDLGLKTLAEGVESEEEVQHLRGQHVTEAQGFLLSRPLTPAALEAQILEPLRTPSNPTADKVARVASAELGCNRSPPADARLSGIGTTLR